MTLSVADLGDDAETRDALATWLLGHGQRISFGQPYARGRRVLVDAVVHVPCRYLEAVAAGAEAEGAGASGRAQARCAALGFVGPMPLSQQPHEPPALRNGNAMLTVVYRGRQRLIEAPTRPPRARSLPVVHHGGNPCHGAPCRTADNVQGAACCRDLTLEVVAPAHERDSEHLERLLLARRSPYLCKTERVSADIIECEVISACGYLEDDGISCALHDRLRPDGAPAKPYVCSDWPDLGPDDVGHPGCRLIPP